MFYYKFCPETGGGGDADKMLIITTRPFVDEMSVHVPTVQNMMLA